MPIYEYQCKSCKAVYELRQGFDAATTHKCEECGRGTAKRVLYAPPVVFKGSGWYLTDSRKSTSAVSESDSSGDAAASKSDSKSETKPEAKSESKAESKSTKSDSKPASTESAAAG